MPTSRSLAALATLAVLLAPAAARAQPASSLDSYRRAREIVDAAVRAHGGADALRALRTVRVTLEGHDVHRHQSRRVAPPYDSTVRRHDLMLDLARGRIVHQQTRGYPGGFSYTTRFVSDADRHYAMDLRNGAYSAEEWPPAAEQLGNLFMVPQLQLLAVHEDPQPRWRRSLGRLRLPSGATVDAVVTVLPNGALYTLGFDSETHLLRAETSVGVDPLAGDEEVVTEYLDWRAVDGVPVPGRRVTTRGGTVVTDLRYTSIAPDYAIPDSLLAPPADFVTAPRAPEAAPVRELAPGVWSVRSGFANVLAVRLADGLLVVDAPPRGARDVVARLAEVAPDVPIRFVVPTHHHDDHFTGVRDYAAAGATVVTTAGNVDYLRQVMAAPTPRPAASAATVETITGKRRVFTDGARTVEIHDIGPSPHADEMLVAWLPAEGILFQGDLIEAPTGVARRGSNAETTLHLAEFVRRKGWDVRTIVGAHGPPMPHAELDALVRFPVLPPR